MFGYYAIQSSWPRSLGLGGLQFGGVRHWRQLKHLVITVNNAYLEINTTKKREKNPELVLALICYYRIQKCILVLDKIKELDPSSSRIAPLEKVIEQFNRLVDLVHRRVIEGEKIPNAEKLLSPSIRVGLSRGSPCPIRWSWGFPSRSPNVNMA